MNPYELKKGTYKCPECKKDKSEKEFTLCYGGWICTVCHLEGVMHA